MRGRVRQAREVHFLHSIKLPVLVGTLVAIAKGIDESSEVLIAGRRFTPGRTVHVIAINKRIVLFIQAVLVLLFALDIGVGITKISPGIIKLLPSFLDYLGNERRRRLIFSCHYSFHLAIVIAIIGVDFG